MITKLYESIKKFILEYYATLITILIIAFVCFYEFPYVVYTPGGIVSLESRIEVENGYKAKGSFNMSYVTRRNGKLPVILLSYIIPNWDLVSKNEVTIDDETINDMLKLEKLQMTSSVDNATIVAYNKAFKKIEITKNINTIFHIDDSAKTNLELFDEIISADGKTVKTIEELREIIALRTEGDTIDLKVNRDGKMVDCYAKIYRVEDSLKIGIASITTYDYNTDPKITVKTKSNESGSSGGLMLSLAIYNSLVEEDITGGKKIVGTGTIDVNGNVGEIDGVKYKLLGAKKSKADIFLCPEGNYEEAQSVVLEYNLDIKVKAVATFDEALDYLKNITS